MSGRAFFAMFDLTKPGSTRMTLMPRGLHSIHSVSIMVCVAALVAEYIPDQGVGLFETLC